MRFVIVPALPSSTAGATTSAAMNNTASVGASETTPNTFAVHASTPRADAMARVRDAMIRAGTNLGPFDAWLATRGARTLSVRMERQSASALALGGFLAINARIGHRDLTAGDRE